MSVERLNNESTGACPLCGERPAYPRAIPSVGDGYCDACDECAPAVVEAAEESRDEDCLLGLCASDCDRQAHFCIDCEKDTRKDGDDTHQCSS